MTLQEAMSKRHMVRKYKDKTIPIDLVEKLRIRLENSNKEYDLQMKLMVNNDAAIPGIFKLILAKGVKNYIILAGKDRDDVDERIGYCGADIMLYAQTLGLNTWWVGGTFSRSNMKKILGVNDGTRIAGIIAVGYGQSQGVPHKSKNISEVCTYVGTMPEWFKNGITGALLAPTAMGKQAFTISGNQNNVSITCDSGTFTGVDTGLVKYHFELAAGKENFVWKG